MVAKLDMEKTASQDDIHVNRDSVGDASSVESPQPHDPALDVSKAFERRVMTKVDLKLIPVLFTLFLLSFLDRTNIGNAKIEGMTKSLHMVGNKYAIALLLFFPPYILLEIPSNLILKNTSPSLWISFIMLGWGICTMCQGLTRSWGGLVACRFGMGVFEAGFVPGCAYLISSYYKRLEFQRRYTLFFSSAILAGAFSGLLAYALEKMDGIGGYEGWRWIFIIEGLLTVVVSFGSYWLIAPWPQDAKFLEPDEKEFLLARLKTDIGAAKMDRLDKTAIMRGLGDIKIWLATLAYFGSANTAYSLTYFVPTILVQMGYKAQDAQLHTIPIYMVALVCALAAAFASDFLHHRFAFVALGSTVASIGFIILLCQDHVVIGVKYFALFLLAIGNYSMQPIIVVWLLNNMGGHYKRAIGVATQIAVGNCAGFVASNVFIPAQQPGFKTGYSVGLALNIMTGFSGLALYLYLKNQNGKKDRGEYNMWFASLPKAERENLGDDHPEFRYTT